MNPIIRDFMGLTSFNVEEFITNYGHLPFRDRDCTINAHIYKGHPMDDMLMSFAAEYYTNFARLSTRRNMYDVESLCSYILHVISEGSTPTIVDGKLIMNPQTIMAIVYYDLFINMQAGRFPRVCPECGDCFYDARPDSKYCSHSCQNKAKTKKYRMKKAEQKAATDVPPCRIIGR